MEMDGYVGPVFITQCVIFMNKSAFEKIFHSIGKGKRILLWITRKSFFLFFVFVVNVSAYANAQRLTLVLGKVPLSIALDKITKQTGIDFFYNNDEFNVERIVNVEFHDVELMAAVKELIGNNYDATLGSDAIIFITNHKTPLPTYFEIRDTLITVKGRIVDQEGKGIAATNVAIKGSRRGMSTDGGGNYSIRAAKDAVLLVTSVGYKPIEISVKGREYLDVEMEQAASNLEGVTISTGKVTRKLENFTGAVFKASGEELRAVGTRNVIQSLKTLDPSFIVVENNAAGSNPNVIPTVEVRGKTSMTTNGVRDQFGGDPNQPLFILDGFESTIKDFYNLDINRVQSILILKDAGSTALYGPKAANGVIVIETKRPTGGKLRVSYTADLRVDIPDLNDYNLMNASEKLQFEKALGRWTSYTTQPLMDSLYNDRLKRVRQGTNTYWLGIPVQTGFTNGHSLYLEGGAQEFVYGIGLNYSKNNGAMKGSDRQTWGTNIDMNYRKKGFNIYNKLSINGVESNESPYGVLTTWAKTNPTYAKYADDGSVGKYLDQITFDNYGSDPLKLSNPLYNASLPSENNQKDFNVLDNLQMNYSWNSFQVNVGLSVYKKNSVVETFVSPLNTEFDGLPFLQKGRFTNTRLDNSGYSTFAGLSYGKLYGGRHEVTGNLRWELAEDKNKLLGQTAVGFPAGSTGDPIFANSYEIGGTPNSGLSISRSNSIQGSLSYAYDSRFLMDLNYTYSGTTLFGAKNRYSPFWSVGAGWNLQNEHFLHINKNVISQLKIRGTVGVTGNQNLAQNLSTSVYGYDLTSTIFGQSTTLLSLANLNLKSQNTLDLSTGIDFGFWRNRLSGYLNAYIKNTDPLIVVFDLPSSTGISDYPTNVGSLKSKGIEFNIKYSPIFKVEKSIVWTIGVTGALIKNRYAGFGNKLESLNEKEETAGTLVRYKDGYSPDDIWSVPSLGIDATTGYEIYVKKNGETSFKYNLEDVIRMGNSRPIAEGAINTTFNYKRFTLGVYIRYRFGGDQFNEALFNKVENITGGNATDNFDRRAFYDRWFKPGDVARYSNINLEGGYDNGYAYDGIAQGGYAFPSSRFIQKDNNITGESITMGYQFTGKKWMSDMKMNTFSIYVITNDIFRNSTIKAERGTAYPYARYVSVSLRANF
jgi:TonB-linked SusC/RagA family outer membrane protein